MKILIGLAGDGTSDVSLAPVSSLDGFGSMVSPAPVAQSIRPDELDKASALSLYKEYLGEEKSSDLATHQFYFPLSYRTKEMKTPIVRTILNINEENNTMTFAGDIPQGSFVRLMKSTTDRLVDGAIDAGQTTLDFMKGDIPTLAILISCVGRKIIMSQRVEEEIEAVDDMFAEDTIVAGFYSYGEIAPFSSFEPCQLHNQTMTITAFTEV